MKILIADDTLSDKIVLKSYLKQLGHEIIDANNGNEAIELFKEYKDIIDLLILDVIMPELNGYEAAKEIRAMMGEHWLPIIFLSGLTDENDLAAGIEAGGDDYLFKPLNKIVLEAKMNAMQRISILRQKLSETNKKLELLAHLDGLTGVANRRYLDQILEREFLLARRNQTPISFCMIDIDFFKAFNDNFGHLKGDECLKKVASILSEIPRRPTDFIARYGGEEFCCILPDTNEEASLILAEKMKDAVQNANLGLLISNSSTNVTVSIGLTTRIPDMQMSVHDIIKEADNALYEAKETGRNRVCVFKK